MENAAVNRLLMLRSWTVHAALTLAVLLQTSEAGAHSYLLMSVHVADAVEQPTWVGIGKREFSGSFQAGRVHLTVNDSLVLERVAPHRYYLRHLDFTQKKRGDRRSMDFPPLSSMHVESHTVHYAGNFQVSAEGVERRSVLDDGDIEISSRNYTPHYLGDFQIRAEGIGVSLSAETIRLACSKFPEIMSEHDLVIPVAGKEPIVLSDPCTEP